jgi:hypothetical protein
MTYKFAAAVLLAGIMPLEERFDDGALERLLTRIEMMCQVLRHQDR